MRDGCMRLYTENRPRFEIARGATHNHQTWPGGYIDHICEVMNIAVLLYEALGGVRSLPFSLSDALVCLYLHDAEKAWKYNLDGTRADAPHLAAKPDRQAFRVELARQYGIGLTDEHVKGIKYAEGESDSEYSPRYRVMTTLAAFCHMCDVWSARGWFDYPLAESDPWIGAGRMRQE